MKRFEGKVAAVTGAGSGIGQAISRRLASEGAYVLLLDFQPDAAALTLEMIQQNGGSGETVVCDVSSEESVRRAFEVTEHVHMLINSAGIAHVGSLADTTAEDVDQLYSVNVRGVYLCMHHALPKLLKAGGTILNLASIASKIGIADRFAYSMSKGAVLSMTLSVARDFADKGIRCNCLCPARVHTPFVDRFLSKNYPGAEEAMFKKLSEYQPLGRMGTPEEIASLALFLCSDEAAFITGAAYDIDGGVISLR